MTQAGIDGPALAWEEALVQRAGAGDVRAFERLYREHSGRVHALCLRMTRDASLAEDCTQETFINAWKALKRFETRSSLSTWLHRIAVNVVLARRRKVTPPLTSLEEESGEADEVQWVLETPLEVKAIEQAIAELPQGARDVVVLHAIHGYSHEEVGRMLGVAEGTCKAQLHRARKLLRERLGVEVE